LLTVVEGTKELTGQGGLAGRWVTIPAWAAGRQQGSISGKCSIGKKKKKLPERTMEPGCRNEGKGEL